ncbi:MAG TPA: amidohydrolase family protein [Bryobacteraceae bacterium]|nr:amidohydrolase family protein [Bryobacteraceae bacterium]
MIDSNVSLERWPFRHVAGDDPASLVARLRQRGVTQAWAGSFDGLLHRDLSAVNARLAAACRRFGPGFLAPFGSINPMLPDWQEDLRRCREHHQMRGIRLHPNYHGYTLADPVFGELLAAATRQGLLVEIALAMEDERTQHPLLHAPPVNPAPLADALSRTPGARVVLLNGNRVANARQLAALGVHFDIAMVEGVGGVARLAGEVSPERVLFGSHSPFFYFESAALKIQEAGLPEAQARAIQEGNARALLA